jgi:hypothetical protein
LGEGLHPLQGAFVTPAWPLISIRSVASSLLCVVLLGTATLSSACVRRGPIPAGEARRPGPADRQVIQALERYRELTLRMDNPGLVALLTPDAEVSHGTNPPVIGSRAILDFLSTFSGFKVLAFDIAGERIERAPGLAIQTGGYAQVVRTPDAGTLSVRGTFRATWKLMPDGEVRLASMHTESLP